MKSVAPYAHEPEVRRNMARCESGVSRVEIVATCVLRFLDARLRQCGRGQGMARRFVRFHGFPETEPTAVARGRAAGPAPDAPTFGRADLRKPVDVDKV